MADCKTHVTQREKNGNETNENIRYESRNAFPTCFGFDGRWQLGHIHIRDITCARQAGSCSFSASAACHLVVSLVLTGKCGKSSSIGDLREPGMLLENERSKGTEKRKGKEKKEEKKPR
jgi:hypothetical protein